MTKLDIYIGKEILRAVFLCLGIILALEIIFVFIGELEELEGDYQLGQAIIFIVLTLPRRLYDNVTPAILLGCLLALGMLANRSELIVMRAAGVSLSRIALSVLKPVLAIMLMTLLLAQYIVPYTEQIAQSRRALLQSGENALTSDSGYWYRDGASFIHINAIEPNGILHGITQYYFDGEGRLQQSSFAERAIYQTDHWLLQDIKTTYFAPTQITAGTDKTRVWETSLQPNLLSVMVVEPEYLSILGLRNYARYLQQQGLEAKEYFLAFWNKLFQPLTTLVMVFIAMSFVFGPLRSATTAYRVFVGVVVGLVFKYMQDLLGPMSLVFDFSPFYAALLPILLGTSFALFLFKKAA